VAAGITKLDEGGHTIDWMETALFPASSHPSSHHPSSHHPTHPPPQLPATYDTYPSHAPLLDDVVGGRADVHGPAREALGKREARVAWGNGHGAARVA
jgi:hypothetical protein